MGVWSRFVVALGAVAASLMLAGSAFADQTIVPLGTQTIADYPYHVSLTRTPSFLVTFTPAPGAGQFAQCSFNTDQQPTEGAGSCGTPTSTNCPAGDACWIFTPTAAQDGTYSAYAYLVDGSTPQPETVQPIAVSATPPDTGRVEDAEMLIGHTQLAIGGRSRNRANPVGAAPLTFGLEASTGDGSTGSRKAQCALTSVGGLPTQWVACNAGESGPGEGSFDAIPLPVAVDSHIYRLWIRAVDAFGRVDPTPSVSPPISPVPCTQRIVGRAPHSLGAILHHTLAVRVSCMEATRVAVAYALTDAEARQTGADQEVWWNTGRVKRAGGSTIVRLRPTRFDPSVVRLHHLKLDLWSGEYAHTGDSGAAIFRAAIFATHLLR